MSAEMARYRAAISNEPVEYNLSQFIYKGEPIAVSAVIRRNKDGSWRGRIVFGGSESDGGGGVSTAEILYAENEDDLWLCVRDLREHHLRDLYRAVAE